MVDCNLPSLLKEFHESSTITQALPPVKRLQIYCDLDGVLADFEGGVLAATGCAIGSLSAADLWSQVRQVDDFFATLPWTADGQELWGAILQLSASCATPPEILSGLPTGETFGREAQQQKQRWCAKNLGADVTVHTGKSSEKYRHSGAGAILIDDNVELGDAWVQRGGIFVHHQSAQSTIQELTTILTGDVGDQASASTPRSGACAASGSVVSQGVAAHGDVGGFSQRNGSQTAASTPHSRARAVSGSVRATPCAGTDAGGSGEPVPSGAVGMELDVPRAAATVVDDMACADAATAAATAATPSTVTTKRRDTAPKTFIICRGTTGMGKSYFATAMERQHGASVCSNDRYWSHTDRAWSLAEHCDRAVPWCQRACGVALKHSKLVVLDNLNMKIANFRKMYTQAKRLGFAVIVVDLQAKDLRTAQQAVRRNKRPTWNDEMCAEMANQWGKYQPLPRA
jgi:hypothetical protein